MGKGVSNRRGREEAARRVLTLYRDYNARLLAEDPVSAVHRYTDPLDREVVGLVTSLLAFGNAKAIQRSVQRLLEILGPSPVKSLSSLKESQLRGLSLLGHRWVRGADIIRLLHLLRVILDREGSLKAFFLKGYREEDGDVAPLLTSFSQEVWALTGKVGVTRGFRYFFPSPKDGSPCKRLNMFLRWMVRPTDGIDLGLWTEISPSKLIIPLDTHVHRFALRFRLGSIRSPSWRLAREVTNFLKGLDPADPVKYDFAICHYGMTVGW